RYRASFARHGVECAQLLLTHEDLSNRRHFMSVRHTLGELFALGVVPIANENDTVATEELRFGDNDRLAAAFATVADADLVILLSDIDALYDADPRRVPEARPIREVPTIDDRVRAVAGAAGSGVGTGGMVSKVQAAEIATEAGIPLVIARGDDPALIAAIVHGEPVGTCFLPNRKVDRRRHWIHFLSKLKGTISVDAGALRALRERGSSLLPIGVTTVRGQFVRGDAVAIAGPDGAVVARGLVGYDHETLARIRGQRSDAAAELLDRAAIDPVVHRNDMVLADEPAH
ncbi:MAG: glutamate 5-kinase, partial [Myxococcales bacterium]|nr:glutamate 5-kinase [Myxococcales bacterium]